jgi:hypothetical protein
MGALAATSGHCNLTEPQTRTQHSVTLPEFAGKVVAPVQHCRAIESPWIAGQYSARHDG